MQTEFNDKTVSAIAALAVSGVAVTTFDLKNGSKVGLKTNGTVVEIAPATKDDHGLDLKPPVRISTSRVLQTADSLVDYVHRFKTEGAILLADIANNRIVAILDYHKNADTPDHAAHKAVLDLPFSEEWDLWSKASDDYLPQLEFARVLEENGGDIVPPSGADLLECCRDLQALRSANFKSAVRTNTDAEKFTYEEDSTLVSKKDGSDGIEVPTRFKLQIPVYFNGRTVDLFAFLRWRPEGRSLKLAIKLSRPEHVRQATFKEIVEDVAARSAVPAVYAAT